MRRRRRFFYNLIVREKPPSKKKNGKRLWKFKENRFLRFLLLFITRRKITVETWCRFRILIISAMAGEFSMYSIISLCYLLTFQFLDLFNFFWKWLNYFFFSGPEPWKLYSKFLTSFSNINVKDLDESFWFRQNF